MSCAALADSPDRVFKSSYGYSISYPTDYPKEFRSGDDITLVYFKIPQANTRLNPRLSIRVLSPTFLGRDGYQAAKARQDRIAEDRVMKRATTPVPVMVNGLRFFRYTYRSEEPNGLPTMCIAYHYYNSEKELEIEALITSATKGGFKYGRELEKVVRTFRLLEL